MATTSKKITVKLLVERKANKVLFAEAGKDFVDFLIGLLSLPLASVVRVLAKEDMAGCLGELYESVENLDNKYIQSGVDITHVLKPMASLTFSPTPTLPQLENTTRNYYTCNNRFFSSCGSRITAVQGRACPSCGHSMTHAVEVIGAEVAKSDEEGFVGGVVTYMVMDDLVISPLSTISSIMVLKKFNVDNFACVDEVAVNIGMDEGLNLLRASLQSKTVLSDIFLSKSSSNVEIKLS